MPLISHINGRFPTYPSAPAARHPEKEEGDPSANTPVDRRMHVVPGPISGTTTPARKTTINRTLRSFPHSHIPPCPFLLFLPFPVFQTRVSSCPTRGSWAMNASEIVLRVREVPDPEVVGGTAYGIRVVLALAFGVVGWSEFRGRTVATHAWSIWTLLASGVSLSPSPSNPQSTRHYPTISATPSNNPRPPSSPPPTSTPAPSP